MDDDKEEDRKKKENRTALWSMGLITTLFAGYFALAHIREWRQVANFSKYIEGDQGVSFYEETIIFWSLLFVLLFLSGSLSLMMRHKLGVILSFGVTVFALVFMFILSPVGK